MAPNRLLPTVRDPDAGMKQTAGNPTRPPVPSSIVAQKPSTHAAPPRTPGAGTPTVPRGSTRMAPPPTQNTAASHSAPPSGLNTNDKTPFNVFAMPKTVGQFNSEVNAAAAPSYQPLLGQNTADVASENSANKLRQSDISSIYSQYGAQAADAFKQVKDALNGIISQNASGDQAAQGNLMAALGSAGQPGNSLDQMMGLPTGDTAAQVAPYATAASGAAGAVGNELKGLASGEIAGVGQGMTGAAEGRTSAMNTEASRHQGVLDTLGKARDTITAGIPAAVEKARQTLVTELQSAHGLQFQEGLASKQFGVTSKVANANIRHADQAAKLAASVAQANIAQNKIKLYQSGETIQLQKTSLDNAAIVARARLAQALATARGKQDANALKYLDSWVTPTKADLVPGHYTYKTDPAPGATIKTYVNPTIDQARWHKDPGTTLRSLMTTYGLSLDRALGLMSSLPTPIGGQWGQQTIGEWAATFKSRVATQQGAAAMKFPQLQKYFPLPPTNNRLSPNFPGRITLPQKP